MKLFESVSVLGSWESTINDLNKLEGVITKELNMFNWHEFQVNGVLVAYIREAGEKIQVITLAKFTNSSPDFRFVDLEGLNKMIVDFKRDLKEVHA